MTHLTNNSLFITQSMNPIECSLVADVVIVNGVLMILRDLYINL